MKDPRVEITRLLASTNKDILVLPPRLGCPHATLPRATRRARSAAPRLPLPAAEIFRSDALRPAHPWARRFSPSRRGRPRSRWRPRSTRCGATPRPGASFGFDSLAERCRFPTIVDLSQEIVLFYSEMMKSILCYTGFKLRRMSEVGWVASGEATVCRVRQHVELRTPAALRVGSSTYQVTAPRCTAGFLAQHADDALYFERRCVPTASDASGFVTSPKRGNASDGAGPEASASNC